MKFRKGELKAIKTTLEQTIHGLGNADKMKIALIWRKHFAKYARHAQPVGLSRGQLKLNVDASVWMNEITLAKKNIIDQMNKRLGNKVIRDIQCKIGEIDRT
ncbi:MAG: DUF721 domain-containing protein [bacterium]